MGIVGDIDPGKSLMFAYAAISVGDVAVGLVSQWLRSRKKALFIFYGLTVIGIIWFFSIPPGQSPAMLYAACAWLGFGTGFWAIFVTIAAEQFGTNIRATAATTVPNMVRGSLNLISFLFVALQSSMGYVKSGWITGSIIMVITIIAALMTEESFHKDLNYVEENSPVYP
jgi:MFS family permease